MQCCGDVGNEDSGVSMGSGWQEHVNSRTRCRIQIEMDGVRELSPKD